MDRSLIPRVLSCRDNVQNAEEEGSRRSREFFMLIIFLSGLER